MHFFFTYIYVYVSLYTHICGEFVHGHVCELWRQHRFLDVLLMDLFFKEETLKASNFFKLFASCTIMFFRQPLCSCVDLFSAVDENSGKAQDHTTVTTFPPLSGHS